MPPSQTIHFDPAGGPLSVQVTRGYAVPGTYNLYLYEADWIHIAKEWPEQVFSEPARNTHELPSPAMANDGRIVELQAYVGVIPPGNEYSVHLKVIQDGTELGTASDAGTGTPPTHESGISVALSGHPTNAHSVSALRQLGEGMLSAAALAKMAPAKVVPAKKAAAKKKGRR